MSRISADDDLVSVEIQLVAKSLWKGKLPASFRPQCLAKWWGLASQAVGLPTAARVYSGPYQIDPEAPLRMLVADGTAKKFVRKRTQSLLLSVMPSMHGGGAKEEKLQNAQSQVAQLCLARGLTLAEATKVTTQLAQHAGQTKMQQALDAEDEPKQWEQMQVLLSSAGLKVPASPKDLAARVTRKTPHQARRRQLFASPLKAEAFTIAGEFFLNDDGSACSHLHSLLPRASGVILLDHEIAAGAIPDLMPFGPDEFGIISIGRRCPHPPTCQQKLHVPVHAKGEEGHILLACCLHNLGEKKVRVNSRQVDNISIVDTVPCTFAAHADEWPGDTSWAELTASPVKTIAELFRQEGIQQPLRQPWARVFKLNGRVSTPEHCNYVQFQACTEKSTLPTLLRLSGHKGAYVVPRDAEGQILAGWSIVWVSSSKPDAIRAAMGVRDQAGIVRARDRFGIRVPENTFDATFKALRPNQDPQPRITVRFLFKLCPVPAGATEQALHQWSKLQSREWLIGAAAQPPAGWLTFNGETLLTVPVPQKAREQSIIQAGRRPMAKPSNAKPEYASTASATDPWLTSDPWADYFRQQAKPAKSSSAASGPPRSIPPEAPIASRFQEQDTRLQKLESAVLALQTGQEDQSRQAREDKEAMVSSLSTMQAHFTASLEAMQAAQQRQQDQLSQGMAELKSIVLAVGQQDQSKKPRHGYREPMELDGANAH